MILICPAMKKTPGVIADHSAAERGASSFGIYETIL
jgi:hypothetical protein